MTFEWFATTGIPNFDISVSLPGLVVTVAYLAVCVLMVIRSHSSATHLKAAQWLMLVGLLISVPITARILLLHLDIPGMPAGLWLPVLGLLPLLVAALWLGTRPTLLVGLVTGAALAALDGWRLTEPLEMALAAGVVALLLNQPYLGRLAQWLRQPLVAMLVGMVGVAWPLKLLGIGVTDGLPFFASLDHLLTVFVPTLLLTLVGALVPGLIVQAVLRVRGRLAPTPENSFESAPWMRHLSQRMVYAVAPLGFLVVASLMAVVATTSYLVATNVVIEQMGRSATNAGTGIPFFIQERRSRIRNLAENQAIVTDDPAVRQALLADDLRSVPFFVQLIYVDSQGVVADVYPPIENRAELLSREEQTRVRLALASGVPAEVILSNTRVAVVSFVAAIHEPGGNARGALIGRTSLENNPSLAPVMDILQTGVGSGWGLLIDSQNHILLSPVQPQLAQHLFDLGSATEIGGGPLSGHAYRQVNVDGTHNLVVIVPVSGQSDWSVVLVEPNEVALRLAVQIAVPTLVLLVIIIGVIGGVGLVIVRGITNPLEELLTAVQHIGEGEFDQPVEISGEDEIGQLGVAFEQMRMRLKHRLDEQERLLRVSRSVSANPELFRAMPPILSSALDVTQAVGVRIALRQAGNGTLQTYSAGDAAGGMAALDTQLTDLVEKQGTVVISQVQRARGSLDIESLAPGIQALVALPLRSENSFHGVLWLTYDHEHNFDQSELTFLGTLAGQAAVAVANARLLADAQEGRQKLEAILESTADGMIVVDHQGKVILMNPAAEEQFSIRLEQARGRPAEEVISIPELAALLTDFKQPTASLELPGRSRNTLLANTSTIVSHDGAIAGRVTLLRDITPIKELDNIKTVFLRMVSHDLRSPLTYMRGYASLLPMSGDLNEAQQEALLKINGGIQHISELTERLLYLSRLKFGDEAELELSLVDVDETLHNVESQLRGIAADKTITLGIDANKKLPLLLVDGMLYQQAISNLIGNAIKYSADGGQIIARAYLDGADRLAVSVSDNGVGIRAEDQGRLFEAFYRIPQREGEPTRPQGSGLGLALVKAIAEAHNGTVKVESKFGEGSTFTILIPIRNPADF